MGCGASSASPMCATGSGPVAVTASVPGTSADQLLSNLKKGASVAVIFMLGSLCPITRGHVQCYEEGRKLLLGCPSSRVIRPARLQKFDECLGLIGLNDDTMVNAKLTQKGQRPISLEQRATLVRNATADYPWLNYDEQVIDVSHYQRHYPNLNFFEFDMNGADDVVKYEKWLFVKECDDLNMIVMGRPGFTSTVLEAMRRAGLDRDDGRLIIGPELPDISSTAARDASKRGDVERLLSMGIWACMLPMLRPLSRAPHTVRRAEIQIGSWHGTLFSGEEGAAKWLRLPKFISRIEVHSILDNLPPHEIFDKSADAVDGESAYEFYSTKAGRVVFPQLDAVMKAPVARVLPFVRQHYKCATCEVCFSLIRRYLERERRQLNPHQDLQAYVSVVFTLNAEEFDGGLYFMANYSSPKRFLPLSTGDAIIHQADLLHGVSVTRGDRWSWSLWIKPEMECKLYIKVRDAFAKTDADQDRRLALPEFTSFLVQTKLVTLQKAPNKAPVMFQEADRNGDDYVDLFEAFTMFFKPSLPPIASQSGPAAV